MKRWITLAVFLLVVVGGGLWIGATNLPGAWYQGLEKPPLTPPNWLFAPAWTLLYVLIAIAGWRSWGKAGPGALFLLWAVQMVLNFAWSPVVFTAHSLGLGLAIILAVLVAIVSFIKLAARADRGAALCFVPYACWVAFASYLNAGLYFLN